MRIKIARTTKVYGRFKAIRTIAFIDKFPAKAVRLFSRS
jgi:hypothetical protein